MRIAHIAHSLWVYTAVCICLRLPVNAFSLFLEGMLRCHPELGSKLGHGTREDAGSVMDAVKKRARGGQGGIHYTLGQSAAVVINLGTGSLCQGP